MIDFTYLWLFILIFVFGIPALIAFVFTHKIVKNVKDSIFWTSTGMMGSLIISLEFQIAGSIVESIPVFDSPVFLSIFIGVLGGLLGTGFFLVSNSIVNRTTIAKRKEIM